MSGHDDGYYPEPPEWVVDPDGPDPVGAADLLDDTAAFAARMLALPSQHDLVAVVLWAAHTHLLDCFESTPRIALLSPEPASGKTRALEVLETLVPHPMGAINATPAAIFRAVSDLEHRPTILFDEIDSIFGPRAKEHEELRGLLNAGHRRTGSAYRCVGEGTRQKVVKFPAYAAVAMAGLGDLPDTLMSRSVVIRMRRRGPREQVEPFRARIHGPEGNTLRERLSWWAMQTRPRLAGVWPDLPDELVDRPADVWEPLIAVADAAGGQWPGLARDAAVALSRIEPTAVSLGVRLLTDLEQVFRRGPDHADAMHTETILEQLCAIDDAPWGDLHGKPIDARGLALRLRKYGVQARDVWIETTRRGYRLEDLWDAWTRYVPGFPSSPSPASARSARSARPGTSHAQTTTPGPSTPSTSPTGAARANSPTLRTKPAAPSGPSTPSTSPGGGRRELGQAAFWEGAP